MKYTLMIPVVFMMVFSGVLQIYAMEKGVFQPPSLEGYAFSREVTADKDGDGVPETIAYVYNNSEGDRIAKYTKGMSVYAYSVKASNYQDTRNDLTKNYVIIDTNCEGKFDQKIDLETSFGLPECLK